MSCWWTSMRNSRTFCGLAVVFKLCFVSSLIPAVAQQDIEARARAALRAATAQVRDLQDQNAQLMAKQAEAERARTGLAQELAAREREIEALRAQILQRQSAAEKANAQIQAE